MEILYYYCQGRECMEVKKLLMRITEKYKICHEIIDLSNNGTYDEEKEKQIYETKFKPRAKLLKKRIGNPITKVLRSRKSRHYYVSIPGTLAVMKDEQVEWFTVGNKEIINFLNTFLIKGHTLLEEYTQ